MMMSVNVGIECFSVSGESKQNVYIAAAVSVGLGLLLLAGIISLLIFCEYHSINTIFTVDGC